MAETKAKVEASVVYNGDMEKVTVECALGNLPRVHDVLKETEYKKGVNFLHVQLNGVPVKGTDIVNDGDVIILTM